jgi:hypothetical protein
MNHCAGNVHVSFPLYLLYSSVVTPLIMVRMVILQVELLDH